MRETVVLCCNIYYISVCLQRTYSKYKQIIYLILRLFLVVIFVYIGSIFTFLACNFLLIFSIKYCGLFLQFSNAYSVSSSCHLPLSPQLLVSFTSAFTHWGLLLIQDLTYNRQELRKYYPPPSPPHQILQHKDILTSCIH